MGTDFQTEGACGVGGFCHFQKTEIAAGDLPRKGKNSERIRWRNICRDVEVIA